MLCLANLFHQWWNFVNVLQHCLGQNAKNAKYAKSQKGVIFLLAQKAKAKTAKRSDGHDLGKKQKGQNRQK